MNKKVKNKKEKIMLEFQTICLKKQINRLVDSISLSVKRENLRLKAKIENLEKEKEELQRKLNALSNKQSGFVLIKSERNNDSDK